MGYFTLILLTVENILYSLFIRLNTKYLINILNILNFKFKERYTINDHWNDHHDYELIFGEKYLGYFPVRPTHTSSDDGFNDWRKLKVDVIKRAPWNPVF